MVVEVPLLEAAVVAVFADPVLQATVANGVQDEGGQTPQVGLALEGEFVLQELFDRAVS